MKKKEIIELSITSVLVVIMIFAFSNASKKIKTRTSKAVLPATVSQAAVPMQDIEQKISSQDLHSVLEKHSQSIELRRDPFTVVPIVMQKDAQAGVVLSGILWDKTSPLAIIDGNVVKPGTRIGNKTIVEIRQDRVIISDGDVFSEIKLQR